VSVVVGIIIGIRQLIPKPQPPSYSAIFIVDVSHATPAELATAEQDIKLALNSLGGVPTSLRVVNGCENSYNSPTVPFGTNNLARYLDAFKNLGNETQGFAAAENAAVTDLNTTAQIKDAKQKLLFLFMAEPCPRSAIEFPGDGLTLNFTWLGPSTAAVSAILRHFTNLRFSVVNAPPDKFPEVVTHQVVYYTTSTTNSTTAISPPSNLTAPSISGTPQQDVALTASSGDWNGSPTSYSYVWQHCDSSGSCSVIFTDAPTAMTSSIYTVQASDAGDTLLVEVTATNSGGASAPVPSAATLAVPPVTTTATTNPAIP
jgi:hypothetical protein